MPRSRYCGYGLSTDTWLCGGRPFTGRLMTRYNNLCLGPIHCFGDLLGPVLGREIRSRLARAATHALIAPTAEPLCASYPRTEIDRTTRDLGVMRDPAATRFHAGVLSPLLRSESVVVGRRYRPSRFSTEQDAGSPHPSRTRRARRRVQLRVFARSRRRNASGMGAGGSPRGALHVPLRSGRTSRVT
jgi:hypothetical protein